MHREQLIVEPDDGAAPILNAIRHAKKSIDLTLFRFDHRDVLDAIKAAVTRGVQVRALIASTNRGGVRNLRRLELNLLDLGVIVARTSADFTRYHAKLMIVDGRVLYVCAFNLTHADLKSRSFGIATMNARLVLQATRLFEADVAHRPYDGNASGLIVSPENARGQLENFLQRASRELLIYDSKLTDKRILQLLDERAKAGVQIRVLGHVGEGSGVPSRGLRRPRLHLRAIVRDGTAAFVGSQSLRKAELDDRREVGISVHEPSVVQRIHETFERDWPSHAHRNVKAVQRTGVWRSGPD
jgi:phosphatidylserine/phosphatidylglycerophosphate/cardiolipin synthase-like enzyme